MRSRKPSNPGLARRRLLRAIGLFAGAFPFVPRAAATAGKVRPLRLQKWQCTNQDCEPYIYDPSLGDINIIDPARPIPPGVAFEDLPDSWLCPVCAHPKSVFVPAGEWVEVGIGSE